MGIIHSAVRAIGDLPAEEYAVIPNELIDDVKISALARMLGIWLRSRPGKWTTNEAAMCKAMGVKDPKTVRKALHELYEHGWARLETNRSEEGLVYQYVYMVRRGGRFTIKRKSEKLKPNPWITTGLNPPSTQVRKELVEISGAEAGPEVFSQASGDEVWA